MNNPNGPYPGRQLFTGLTVDGNPSLAYLVTGRSRQSRERVGMQMENKVIMGPIGNQQYDPLRHYTAVEYDNNSGIAVVSNGIQTEAIFETYRLLNNTGSVPTTDYMEKILDGAGAEPDSLHTPRIAGVITCHDTEAMRVYIIGIKIQNLPAKAFQIRPEPSTIIGISTYGGDLGSPESFNPESELPKLEFGGRTAEELAKYIFDMSHATYRGEDIRVCSIAGIHNRKNHTWDLALVNKHQIKG